MQLNSEQKDQPILSSPNGSKPFVMGSTVELNTVYHEMNVDTMARMADNSVDLVMTSPPYADARKSTYGGVCADEYVEWFKPIAKEIYRILKPTGSFILNIGDNTVDGETHLYTFELPIMLKREIGFKFIDPLIWHKKNPAPGRFKNRFKDGWEFCFHFTKTLDIKFKAKEVATPTKPESIARDKREKNETQTKSGTGSGGAKIKTSLKICKILIMKNVKKIEVTVTYKVGLGNVKMPENVYKQIVEAAENGDDIEGDGLKYNDACEWLTNNVKERDCFEWKTEINEIS